MHCSPWSKTKRPNAQYGYYYRGQGMVEYMLALVLIVILLAIPWGQQQSPAVQLMNALRSYYTHFSTSMSLV